jgi:hypothetical protein
MQLSVAGANPGAWPTGATVSVLFSRPTRYPKIALTSGGERTGRAIEPPPPSHQPSGVVRSRSEDGRLLMRYHPIRFAQRTAPNDVWI